MARRKRTYRTPVVITLAALAPGCVQGLVADGSDGTTGGSGGTTDGADGLSSGGVGAGGTSTGGRSTGGTSTGGVVDRWHFDWRRDPIPGLRRRVRNHIAVHSSGALPAGHGLYVGHDPHVRVRM